MVDERGETAVRVELRVFGSLVLVLEDVDRDDVVLEAKLFENDGDLPIVIYDRLAIVYPG